MDYITALLVEQHHDDLLREAEEGRRAALVRGVRQAPWSAFSARLGHLVRGTAGSTRQDLPAGPSAGTCPAAA
jgi:hypothetical protein